MKTIRHIALLLLAAVGSTACKDDPELLTTDIGPEMNVLKADASGSTAGRWPSRWR